MAVDPSDPNDEPRTLPLGDADDAQFDEELIARLVTLAYPLSDPAYLTKLLLEKYGGAANILAAEDRDLGRTLARHENLYAILRLIHTSAVVLARVELCAKPVMANYEALIKYMNCVIAREQNEQVRLLFLDAKNRLIADEVHSRGTVTHTQVYPREVARRALELNASALIVVHNHPSGDPTPSPEDIVVTARVAAALDPLSITLQDHIIIGAGRWISLKKEGYLEPRWPVR